MAESERKGEGTVPWFLGTGCTDIVLYQLSKIPRSATREAFTFMALGYRRRQQMHSQIGSTVLAVRGEGFANSVVSRLMLHLMVPPRFLYLSKVLDPRCQKS